MRTFVAVVALVAVGFAPAAAQPSARCSTDAFPVGGQSVAVTVCAAAPQGGSVTVSETFKSAGKSFVRDSEIDLMPGAAVARTVDDASLAPLGLAFTLHLTLAYRGGAAAIEHALLLPGAVPLK
jgi:hypothetical protein